MLGIETEYALSGTRDRRELLGELVEEARRTLPCVTSPRRSDLFLGNGSRLYVDCGAHPEIATPECTDPSEVVRYVLAGEKILSDLVSRIDERHPGSRTIVFKCNVDYSGARTTWGCHESYLHRSDPLALPDQLVPHLVSRLVYTGAGGFDPLSPGIEFSLSPRVTHLQRVVSDESTHNRGIFHTKDEPLSRGDYHRLHVLCGESLCSELGSWLKVGATALVVALVDGGLRPGDDVTLRAPLKAIRALASDPTGTQRVAVRGGRRLTAVEIQRHYLELVESRAGDLFLPPWAGEVCRRWRAMLDRIEGRRESLVATLDWAVKRALYEKRARRRGFEWETVAAWTHVVKEITHALREDGHDALTVDLASVVGRGSPIPRTIAELSPFLAERSLEWDGLARFLSLRNELFEIDVRFGQIGGAGLFASMDRDGVLDHRAPGVEAIERAVSEPPVAGRAHVRGNVIRRVAPNPSYRCDWASLWSAKDRRLLDLSDPFETTEKWRDAKPPSPRFPRPDVVLPE